MADASSARAAIVAAAQSAMQEVEDAPWNVGEQRDCKGDKCWVTKWSIWIFFFAVQFWSLELSTVERGGLGGFAALTLAFAN